AGLLFRCELSATTLVARRATVFSKTARDRPGVGPEHAGRNAGPLGRRMRGSVLRRGEAVDPAEARRERADALQADGQADVRHRPVCVAQQLGCALQSAGEQVLVRRLAERAAELAAEM